MCLSPVKIYDMNVVRRVRCGKCDECLLGKQREWITRICCEPNLRYMLLLTFNNENVDPLILSDFNPVFDEDSSSSIICYDDEVLTYDSIYHVSKTYDRLVYEKHLSYFKIFIYLLRKKVKEKYGISFRYFSAYQYGDENERPHFHVLIFCDKPILDISCRVSTDSYNNRVFRSLLLEKCWTRGFSSFKFIENNCYHAAKYCTRYLIEGLVTSSRLLGFQGFIKKHLQTYLKNGILIVDGHPLQIPRLWMVKVASEYPDSYAAKVLLQYTDYTIEPFMTDEELNKIRSVLESREVERLERIIKKQKGGCENDLYQRRSKFRKR